MTQSACFPVAWGDPCERVAQPPKGSRPRVENRCPSVAGARETGRAMFSVPRPTTGEEEAAESYVKWRAAPPGSHPGACGAPGPDTEAEVDERPALCRGAQGPGARGSGRSWPATCGSCGAAARQREYGAGQR